MGTPPTNTPTKVMIVDDSASVRRMLSDILQSESGIELVGTAQDPIIAAKKMRKMLPDVLILDIEMPRMDGLTFLKKIMAQHPIPTIICSSLASPGSQTELKALALGAVGVMEKPRVDTPKQLDESRIQLVDTIFSAAKANLKRLGSSDSLIAPKHSADVILEGGDRRGVILNTDAVVVIGVSTGGTDALAHVLRGLPPSSPGLAIVLHMPERFTASYAKRLNDMCQIKVMEASDGDTLGQGTALLAPGGQHMLLRRRGARYYVETRKGPLVSRHRPSVDVLFRSAARYAGQNAIGVILTGMGDDGARGMKEMFDVGCYTMAQDEESCVVYGMPKEAVALGGVHEVVGLKRVGRAIMRAVERNGGRASERKKLS